MQRENRPNGRSGTGRDSRHKQLPPADPVLLNLDLERWAGAPVARTGRKYALLGRVESLRLTLEGTGVIAQVRGNRSAPHSVEIHVRDGSLNHRCTCSQEDGRACRHAVAALEALRFPLTSASEDDARGRRRKHAGRRARGEGRIVQKAQARPGFVIVGVEDRTLTREERVAMASRTELRERKQRARQEKKEVRPLPSQGMPPRFQVGRKGACYEVVLRGEKGVWGSCTCPDFQKNELGTCKHIERVRQWFSRKKKDWPERTISMFYSPRSWTETGPNPMREIRLAMPPGAVLSDLERWFDEDGWLRKAPDEVRPDAWVRQARQAVQEAAGANGWNLDLAPGLLQRIDLSEPVPARSPAGNVSEIDGGWDDLTSRLNITLHRYQEAGVRFLVETRRALLADDMGLGKTVQAVAAALFLRKARGIRKCLVVCPSSLKHQWRNEIHKVCGEWAEVVDGRKSGRMASYESWRSGFLVINYELVLRDLDLLRAAGPDLVILDEAQRIKNWETKTARAVKRLRSPYAYILTGTPLENRLTELHSLVEFLYPRALGPRWRLLPFHAVTDQENRIVAYEDLELLRAKLKPFFLRRERSMVLDQLPDRTDNTFWIDMTPAQMRPYRRLSAKIARLLAGGGALSAVEGRMLLQTLTSMRILCNGLAQYSWARFEEMVDSAGPVEEPDIAALHAPKLQEFVDVLEDILDGSSVKVVVFSQWERMLKLTRYAIGGLLYRRGETTAIFHGGLNSKARSLLLDRFRTEDDFRVLLSTDTGGLGLNLQEVASVVVNLEVPWNPAILEQRIARVHRMGQRRGVHVLNFVTRDALEERVRRVVDNKRALFDGLLVEGADQIRFDSQGKASFVEQVRDLIDGG